MRKITADIVLIFRDYFFETESWDKRTILRGARHTRSPKNNTPKTKLPDNERMDNKGPLSANTFLFSYNFGRYLPI